MIDKIKDNSAYTELVSNEGTVIISEHGGRVLGFFPKEDCFNLLWVNSNITEVIKARSHEIGGERYWISPERDFFYKKPESFEEWECQSSLDPANYETLWASEKSCTVSSNIFVLNQRTKQGSRGEITRQIKLIEEPYNTGVSYSGVEILDDCILYRPGLKVNGWSLTQVISGGLDTPGTVLIPMKSNPKPLSYFDFIPDDRLIVSDNYISFKIDVNAIYKLAIRPEDINFENQAKIGYVVKISQSDDYCFIVKLSDDIPKNQHECFDVARNHPGSEIGVIQSYNSESPNKPMLGFGEIELQLNAFTTIDNASHGKAKHQLFGYIGSKEEILMVVKKYLGISDPYLFI
ncbi:MAG: DUF6786 family protein [Promethearchaeota archaeon]